MTGHISPQYHLVFDDNFTTVESMKQGVVATNWDMLVQTQQALAMPEQYILSPKWERHTANAYQHKQSTPTMLSWPSDMDAACDNENMDEQAAGMLNEATEGDTAANEGGSSLAPATSYHSTGHDDISSQQQPNLRLTLSPVDLSTTRLRRLGRERKMVQK